MIAINASNPLTVVDIEELGIFVRRRISVRQEVVYAALPTLDVLRNYYQAASAPGDENESIALGLAGDVLGETISLSFASAIGGHGRIEVPIVWPSMDDYRPNGSYFVSDAGHLHYILTERLYSGFLREDVWARWALMIDTAHFVLESARMSHCSDLLEYPELPFDPRGLRDSRELSWQASVTAGAILMPARGLLALERRDQLSDKVVSGIFGVPVECARGRVQLFQAYRTEMLTVTV